MLVCLAKFRTWKCSAITTCVTMKTLPSNLFRILLITKSGLALLLCCHIADYLTADGGDLAWNTATASWEIWACICLMLYGGCCISDGQPKYIQPEVSTRQVRASQISLTPKPPFSNS